MSTPPSLISTSSPCVAVEALVDGGEVAGELALGEPLQLQGHLLGRRRAAAASRGAPPLVVGLRGGRAGGDGQRASRGRGGEHARESSGHRDLLQGSRIGQVGTTAGDQALGEQPGQVEQQPQHDRGGDEGPRPGVGGVGGGRGDAAAQPVLQAAEVLRDDRGDHRGRRGQPQAGHDVRHRAGQPDEPRELPGRGGQRGHQLVRAPGAPGAARGRSRRTPARSPRWSPPAGAAISVVEPNIVVNTGASATIGTALAASTTGVVSSRDAAATGRRAAPAPPRAGTRRPARPARSPPVTAAVDEQHRELRRRSARAIALGAGSRNAGTPASRPRPAPSSSSDASTPSADRRPQPARPARRGRHDSVPLAQRLAHRGDRRRRTRPDSRTSSTSSGAERRPRPPARPARGAAAGDDRR